MRNAEVIYGHDDANEDGWGQKDQAMRTSDTNWYRLSRIVHTDLFHESGLYEELSRRQQAELNRKNHIALDPKTPRTRRENWRANHEYQTGFPLWSIPILFAVAALGAGVEVAERYSKTDKLGSNTLARQFQKLDRSLMLSTAVSGRDAIVEGFDSTLMPELRVGKAAILASTEPADYVVNVDHLLEVAELAVSQDGTTANLDKEGRPEIFRDVAPKPHSRQDQRARAAEIFMNSELLKKGELSSIKLERRAEFFPDGDRTFRIHTTMPYAYLYKGMDLADDYTPTAPLYADRLLSPDPIAELLDNARV